MSEVVEELILSNLIYNEPFTRKVLPYLQESYFQEQHHQFPFKLIHQYFNKFNALPTKEALNIELEALTNISEKVFEDSKTLINSLERDKDTKLEWIEEKTEKFCKDKALYLAISESIKIMDQKDKNLKNSIPKILQDALAVSFETKLGHDYIEDAEARYDYYHKTLNRIPFKIKMLNTVTGGGTPSKTLNIIMGGTGVGKTLIMTSFAAADLEQGKNVLYITLEMSEEEISKRIDANLLDFSMNDIDTTVPKDIFLRKIDKIRNAGNGKLLVYEYPTAGAGAANFRYLINELKLKKKFIPDIIYIDYLNICCSSRFKLGNNVNTNSYVKAISEEIRGLAIEFNVPVWSSCQFNREGNFSSDPDMDNVAESFGLTNVADFILAVIQTEELEQLEQYLFKQLKNRYRDKTKNKRFIVGCDKSKQRLYDVEQNGQNLSNEVEIPKQEVSKPKIKTEKLKGFK